MVHFWMYFQLGLIGNQKGTKFLGYGMLKLFILL